MPAFVPVYDPEVPRAEQEHNSEKLLKHRKWDNPYVVLPNNKTSHGYEKSDKRSDYKDFDETYKYNKRKDKYRDDRFYRKNVRDDFDYVSPKRKKLLKFDNKSTDDKSSGPDKKVIKTVKKDTAKREYK